MVAAETGRVIRVDSKVCWVRMKTDTLVKCPIRGRLFLTSSEAKNPVAVGDRVEVLRVPDSDEEGSIESVLPRRNKLSRPVTASSGRREQVIVANVDILAVVVAAARPRFKLGLIDRYLIVAARQELHPIVVVNKIDLVDPAAVKKDLSVYANLNVQLAYTSALRGDGMDDLARLVQGKQVVFSGHSGVGKSTLLNALQPDLEIQTKAVSSRTGKGVHTTTRVTLFETKQGGSLIDTPGIRAMGLWQVEPNEVDLYFKEITEKAAECRFRTCTHNKEPGCAVKEAVERGEIHHRRFESFRRIAGSLEEEQRERGY